MLNQVTFLWPVILIFCCAAIKCDKNRNEELKIEPPENCSTIRRGYRTSYYFTCPTFTMTMHTTMRGTRYEEYVSSVHCTSNSSPYEYLRRTNSSRNSLSINCAVPESGSFGTGWPQLEYLSIISFGQIGPWKREHFGGLNNLKTLSFFAPNSSHQMPDDLFADLGKLRILSLWVKNLNKTVLKDLKELEELKIHITSAGELHNVNAKELENSLKLQRLILNRNEFERMTKQFFKGFSSVEVLIFKHNKFEAIDANAFEQLTSLKTVRFEFNKWNSLPSGLFSKNEKLEEVIVDGDCKLTTLPSGFLSNLPNLRRIEIFCKLTTIPNDLISGSTNLETLDLRANELTSLPRDLLFNHTKLKEIKLGENMMSDLPHNHFYNKSNLTEINFTTQKMTLLP